MPSVLVVDDEHIIANTLVQILAANGYAASAAYSAAEALAKVDGDGCPDMLLTDVVMPGINGVDLAIKLREKCSQVKITLISGNAHTPALVEKARSKGFEFALLPKPLHPRALLQHLRA